MAHRAFSLVPRVPHFQGGGSGFNVARSPWGLGEMTPLGEARRFNVWGIYVAATRLFSNWGKSMMPSLGGSANMAQGGRGAGGKAPFVAAIMTNDKGHPISMRFSVVPGFNKNDISNWAKKHLFPGTSVVSDGLNCFPAVKDAGCDHCAIIKSGGTTSMEYSEFKWLDTMIGNVKNSIHGTYHAISEKHVPRYLAEFCFRFNRRFELGKMIKQLAQAAVNTLPMAQRI